MRKENIKERLKVESIAERCRKARLRWFGHVTIIFGVVPLRRFPVGRRGIGCRVPILGGRRLAGLVSIVERACPSRGCQAGMAVQLVGPAPTSHGALGGRQAFAGCGPATGASASAQPSEGRTKEWWLPLDTTSR